MTQTHMGRYHEPYEGVPHGSIGFSRLRRCASARRLLRVACSNSHSSDRPAVGILAGPPPGPEDGASQARQRFRLRPDFRAGATRLLHLTLKSLHPIAAIWPLEEQLALYP